MSENDLGTFPSRAALRDRIRKAKRERRHSIGGLEPHIRRELSLQMTSNNKQHLPSIQRSSSCENMISSRHTSPSLRKKGKKFDLGTRNISVTSLGSHVSDMSSPVLNLRKFNNTSSVGSAPTGSVGSMDSAISCGSSILLDQGQQISMQQQGRRETLNLMARIAAKNSFSGQNYLQGLKYEMDDSIGDSSWLILANLEEANAVDTYISALYWSVTTITTVGYGDLVPVTSVEKVFVIFSVAVGAVTYGSVISTFVAASAASNLKKSQVQSRLDAIVRYMRERKYPRPLFKKVFSYFRHFYDRVALDESAILNDLSENLRVEVATYMSWRAFRGNELFKAVEIKYLTVILLMTKPVRRSTNEILYRSGDVGLEMYIVSRRRRRRRRIPQLMRLTVKRRRNVRLL